MPDLLQSAKLFDVGTRLQTASSCVSKFAKGVTLDENEQGTFKWAGSFLAQVDWTSEIEAEPGEGGGLTVSATNTRPKFYASLLKIGPEFRKLGIDSEEEIGQFLSGIYRLLLSGGNERTELPYEQLRLASKLLHILSLNIMVDISNNMLPRRRALLSIGESF